MILRWLEFENFRSLRADRIEFAAGVNLFWGANGAGKSNLLEAVYFLLTTRSFRTQRSAELMRMGADHFRVAGELEGRTGCNLLEATQEDGKRSIFLDGKKVGLEEILQRYSVLAFSSHQLNVFHGGPRDRRRFLDRGILAQRPAYLRELGDFFRTLAQRNRLLKHAAAPGELAAWDERFITAAARVVEERRGYASRLCAATSEHAVDLLPEGVPIRVEYRPGLGPDHASEGAGAEEQLRCCLKRAADAERRRGHSLFGPHRDDLRLYLGDIDLLRHGSAGQQRIGLVALKMTRLEMYRKHTGEAPVLLVDDIDSDLDDAASDRLLARVGGGQALLTTCKRGSRDRHRSAARVFRVHEGEIRPENGIAPAASAEADRAMDGTQ